MGFGILLLGGGSGSWIAKASPALAPQSNRTVVHLAHVVRTVVLAHIVCVVGVALVG